MPNKIIELPMAEKEARISVNLRLPEDLNEEINELAKERGVAKSSLAVTLLRWALSEWRAANGTKKRG